MGVPHSIQTAAILARKGKSIKLPTGFLKLSDILRSRVVGGPDRRLTITKTLAAGGGTVELRGVHVDRAKANLDREGIPEG